MNMWVKTLIGILVIVALVGFLWLIMGLPGVLSREPQVIGVLEHVIIDSPAGPVDIIAKVDTGADFSAIDRSLALSLGFKPSDTETKAVMTEIGLQERPTLRFKYKIGTHEINSLATVSDRSSFSTQMLIGREDIKGLIVDPSRDFLTTPESRPPVQFFGFLNTVDSQLSRIIPIIPILGTAVVILRLLAGVRTYGIFAPTIIAVTLLSLGIIPGFPVYVFLIVTGIVVKILVLDRLNLPQVAVLSLIIFLLVLLMVGITSLPAGFTLSFNIIFFPLIISTYIVEQASKSITEHGVVQAMSLLISTLVTALLLTLYASFLIEQSATVLWTFFAVSIAATIAAGQYLGLRLSELIRFKFLRRTHVH
ncbi:MAG: hypothetical protein HYX80_04315 [Chloroflexi bacterium]|nr:hypothetical protein [Chloroflexota bacterium]